MSSDFAVGMIVGWVSGLAGALFGFRACLKDVIDAIAEAVDDE